MPFNNFQQGGSPRMLGGSDSVSYVDGEMLKEVSAPVEALLGAANGAIGGGFVALVGSAAVSALQHSGTALQRQNIASLGQKILENISGSHKFPMIASVAALGALGAVVRFSRAQKHNEWSERHYALLQQEAASHTGAIEAERKDGQQQGMGRG
jgi:hypothetical protein